jgi:hypothetical protein
MAAYTSDGDTPVLSPAGMGNGAGSSHVTDLTGEVSPVVGILWPR